MEVALDIKDLTVAYHRKPVLWGIDVAIPKGKMVGIVGPNGAGKSTLIKSIMGMLPMSSGTVQVFGKPQKQSVKRIGYVPQRESVDWDFPITVMEVVLMGRYGHLGLLRRPSKADRQKAHYALQRVNMLPYADRQIGDLSGGQQQRVFLARALAQESDLYLMDEPFAGVDAATEQSIIDLMKELREQGKTLVVVHHDLATVDEYFDMLLLLNVRAVGFGPTKSLMNEDMLRKTYGGALSFLPRLNSTPQNT